MGSVAGFFTHPVMMNKYRDVAALVRNGGATDHTLAPNDNVWVEFARYMAPMFALPASIAATHVTTPGKPAKVLDIAAGHGLFGIHVALHNPAAEITFQDWENVLEVARENAANMGIAGRFRTIPGSAFEVDLGTGLRRSAAAQLPAPLRFRDQRNAAQEGPGGAEAGRSGRRDRVRA